MNLTSMKDGIIQRLPGNRHLRILKECIALCRQFPKTPIYRTVLALNLRAYFCIRPHYGPFWCKEAIPSHPLYHVTEASHLPSIERNGLQNTKTGVVFLTNTLEAVQRRIVKMRIQDPVVFLIDSEIMCSNEFHFYVNQTWDHIWLTQSVPRQYIRKL